MSNDENKYGLVEDVSESEELVEDEQVQDEEIIEAKARKEAEEKDEDEEEVKESDEDDEDEEEVKEDSDEDDDEDEKPVVEMPKTKAAIMASVNDMLKKSKKLDAQKIYASVCKTMESDEGDDEEEEKPVKEDINVDHIDYSEDLESLVAEEATLSDGFQAKAGIIFEAALKSKVGAEIDRLESEYVTNLEEEVTEIKSELVEKVDSYLNYVVSNWMTENEVAVSTGLRTEIAEDFMSSLQSVFKEHYIEVPEGKVDLVDELADQVAELEESLNKSTEDNIALTESVSSLERAEVVRNASSGLALTEAEKLASLVEDIDFDDAESFEMKVNVVKESYFRSEAQESVDEAQNLVGTDEAPADISDVMARYTSAISKYNKV
tara:strand:+ start:30 stop:1166 length:1137 start_codon:yes stop_codon:yes gene_type:complete